MSFLKTFKELKICSYDYILCDFCRMINFRLIYIREYDYWLSIKFKDKIYCAKAFNNKFLIYELLINNNQIDSILLFELDKIPNLIPNVGYNLEIYIKKILKLKTFS